MRRRNFKHPPEFSWDAGILSIRQNFHMMQIFCVFAKILGRRQYFMILLDFATANICLYFQYLLCIWVCANIFAQLFNLRFKIDTVVMIIWSIVIIINFVLTL